MTNRLREALETGEFVVTYELIPGRGANEPGQIKEMKDAIETFKTGRVHAISITDNPGGNPALAASAIAVDLHTQGVPTIVHFTCKDKSRNQMQAELYAMQRQGLENILVMTGDYQYSGWNGRARPVFDLDPVQVLQLIQSMNDGLTVKTSQGETREQGADFFPGAVVSPFKWTEAETITQYLKLEKKIFAGAHYLISQLGYDARKMEELILYVREKGYDIPLIANVYVLSAGTARYMKKGNVPGCYISDELLETLAEEAKAEDKGRSARLLRAAKMVAIARGLGYAGVHISGIGLNAETFTTILDGADEIQDRWREWAAELSYGQQDGFYLYQKKAVPNAFSHTERTESYRGKRSILKGYKMSRFFHRWFLTPNRRFYGSLKSSMERRERKRGLNRRHGFEHLTKALMYGCMDCGDCGLEAAVYTCPMSQCPKCQRNGPCGGSADGWCEVYPQERYCIYFKAYHRLKKYRELEKLDSYITPPNNWDFFETSAWSNYTHERDNAAHRQYLPPCDQRPQATK